MNERGTHILYCDEDLMRPTVPGWLSCATVALDLWFGRLPFRGSELSLGHFDTQFLPFSKLIGNVLWRFRLLDLAATARFHFFLK